MDNHPQAEIELLREEIRTLKSALANVTTQVQPLNMLAQALVILHQEPAALRMVFEHATPEASAPDLPFLMEEEEAERLAHQREWILRLLRTRG
ncbi:hypothetical protein AVME950_02925 [Acidovorax sp. SUPP950]|uniref:hypothetical protein n=1 Tax=Acidovorax sp. SUPP950 TaxID=511901 RepID=UPI0023D732B1|nr:hypothetical protein [Acidovorax sp. SUPP950]GKS73803.1 hypothetical protein AVME950_02925 [Acidovorax sp. SUPP950]